MPQGGIGNGAVPQGVNDVICSYASHYSPFHRIESPTQSSKHAAEQRKSMELRGQPARQSGIPSVKAYRGKLPAPERGVEFATGVAPTRGSGTPYEARWYEGTTGVLSKPNDFVAIPLCCFKNRQP
jgi:hypothetical protein